MQAKWRKKPDEQKKNSGWFSEGMVRFELHQGAFQIFGRQPRDYQPPDGSRQN